MSSMCDPAAAHDGPIPPAALAASRWGAGAWERLARGADAAVIEARLREIVGALGRIRRSAAAAGSGEGCPVLQRLARAVAEYRRAALAR